jgi:KUP system potassium uptake protein
MNYFGQGALLIREPTALSHPSGFLRAGAPTYILVPLVVLSAHAATVIASQAVITGRLLA